jgi:hypothetical protein
MNILLGDFNGKVASEVSFKPTTGNDSVHEISNDNEVRVVNFATSRRLSRIQCSLIAPFINTLEIMLMGKSTIRLIMIF